jgi:hypothetical protein
MTFRILNRKWFWFFGALLSISSCTDVQKVVHVAENEILLIINKSNSYILVEGEHSINQDSKTISFNKTDSLIMKEFDILDTNAQSLYCKPIVKYNLTINHVKNIAENFEWIHNIQSYKNILIGPEIRSYLRNIGLQTQHEKLIDADFVSQSNIENIVAKDLEKFIKLKSIEIKFYKK